MASPLPDKHNSALVTDKETRPAIHEIDQSYEHLKTAERRKAQEEIQNKAARAWQWLFRTPWGLGLIFLVLINVVLSLTQPLAKINPAVLPATHTWTWWATQEFLNENPTPPVVLVGSSLLMHPISRADADYLNQDLDYVHHHYSAYLERQLQEKAHTHQPIKCFNFALPGDLVSDDYMIVRGLFKGTHKPQYIILGLSLRDFIDNVVNCPGHTPPFRYLKRFTTIDDLVDLALPHFWQQFDYRLGKIFYLWDRKLDLQVFAQEQAKNFFTPLFSRFASPSLLNNLDYRKHVPNDLHSEVEEGMAIVKAHQPYSYEANYADYKRRCGHPNETMFKIQQSFLEKLIALSKKENIGLIILNMPLTKENLALMPAGSYEHYLAVLQDIANRNHCPFVDLNLDHRFVHSDFYDTAHMNGTGGKKLLDAIAEIHYLKL